MAAEFLDGNRLTLLNSGEQYFPALIAAIDAAEREIYLEAYIFAFFLPAGCVVATPSGATVAYTFTNCTGPYGLVRVNGTVNATFSNRTATGVIRSSTRSVTLVSANSAATREDSIIVPPPNAPQSTAVAGAK